METEIGFDRPIHDDIVRVAHFAGGPWDGLLVNLGLEFAGPEGTAEQLAVELDRNRGVVHHYRLESFCVSRVAGTTYEHSFYRHVRSELKT